MRHIVSLSGGVASAVAAQRVIDRYGANTVTLWFADTLAEDGDLYRFLDDLRLRWPRAEWVTFRDGRTPLGVAEAEHIIPNQKIAPCSKRLKIEPFAAYLATVPTPATVYLGLDWREQRRHAAPQARYGALEGVTVEYPLLWAPIEYRPYGDVVESWGIRAPRLYALGWSHNNCAGACVKQGSGDWARLLRTFPSRFAHIEAWETAQRAKGEPWSRYAIAKEEKTVDGERVTFALPLSEIRRRVESNEQVGLFADESLGCFCGEDVPA